MSDKRIYGGVLCFNKPSGCTSHDVIYKIRRLYGTKQVGHAGTLDPMATGVLTVMVGRAVKASEFLSAETKEYTAGIKLGITTDTEDISGQITSDYSGKMPSATEFKEALEHFKGHSMQIPPMYSAIKVGGRKLMDIAREGREIQRSPRAIFTEKLELLKVISENEYLISAKVSKGTYIRTLCADIGKYLGTGAVMSSLTRTVCGNFTLDDCYTLEQLENMSENQRLEILKPVETLFTDFPKVELPDFFCKLAKCGCEIYQSKIKTSFEDGKYIKLYGNKGFFALGQVMEFENGSAIKPVKQFLIDN